MENTQLLAAQLQRILDRQPLAILKAKELPGVGELMSAGRDRESGLLAVSLLSPVEWSATLYLIYRGEDDAETGSTAHRRLAWMEAREGLRHMLHPSGKKAGEAGARPALLKVLRESANKASAKDELVLPFITQPQAWESVLNAMENNEDRPRAFGVEKAFVSNGHLTNVRDLNGSLNDFYQLPACPT